MDWCGRNGCELSMSSAVIVCSWALYVSTIRDPGGGNNIGGIKPGGGIDISRALMILTLTITEMKPETFWFQWFSASGYYRPADVNAPHRDYSFLPLLWDSDFLRTVLIVAYGKCVDDRGVLSPSYSFSLSFYPPFFLFSLCLPSSSLPRLFMIILVCSDRVYMLIVTVIRFVHLVNWGLNLWTLHIYFHHLCFRVAGK